MNDKKSDDDEEFQCALCGGVFTCVRSNEEAMKEYRQNFPEEFAAGIMPAIICDDCFQSAWSQQVKH